MSRELDRIGGAVSALRSQAESPPLLAPEMSPQARKWLKRLAIFLMLAGIVLLALILGVITNGIWLALHPLAVAIAYIFHSRWLPLAQLSEERRGLIYFALMLAPILVGGLLFF